MNLPIDPIAELARRVWVTRGSRFAAHRRLLRKAAWSTWAIAVLSTYIIGASLLGPFLLPTGALPVFLNSALVVASVLVIVLSLIETAQSYPLRASRLHDCAVRLGALELTVTALASPVTASSIKDDLPTLQERYFAILAACPDNHTDLDFDAFRLQHHSDYKIKVAERITIWLRIQANTVGPYLAAMLVPPLLLFGLASGF